MSQQHARVSQRRICSDNCTCCHTEREVADQTFFKFLVCLFVLWLFVFFYDVQMMLLLSDVSFVYKVRSKRSEKKIFYVSFCYCLFVLVVGFICFLIVCLMVAKKYNGHGASYSLSQNKLLAGGGRHVSSLHKNKALLCSVCSEISSQARTCPSI